MQVVETGELTLITGHNLLSYVPICNKTGGYVSEECGSEFKIKEFVFSVAKMTTETLTIPPYFINKQFCIVYGACMNKLVMDSYGGTATELSYIKFTGESLDNLTGFLQRVKKECYIACVANGLDLTEEIGNYFVNNLLRVTLQGKMNKRGDKYFACQFASLPTPYPVFTGALRDIEIVVPNNLMRVRSSATLEITELGYGDDGTSASASSSSSASSDYSDGEAYPF